MIYFFMKVVFLLTAIIHSTVICIPECLCLKKYIITIAYFLMQSI